LWNFPIKGQWIPVSGCIEIAVRKNITENPLKGHSLWKFLNQTKWQQKYYLPTFGIMKYEKQKHFVIKIFILCYNHWLTLITASNDVILIWSDDKKNNNNRNNHTTFIPNNNIQHEMMVLPIDAQKIYVLIICKISNVCKKRRKKILYFVNKQD
jgi:hypothetical protein